MIYAYVRQNILYLLHRIGTLQREQLPKFFSPELSAAKIQRTLNELVLQNELKFDPKKERYSFHSAPEVTENVLSRRIDAFWVVANMGSINVVDVDLLEYPSQFSVIDVNNNLYDVTM